MCERITSSCLGIVIGPILASGSVVGAQVPRLVDERGEELVVDPLVDVDPLDADAGLAGVGAGAPERGVGGGVEVGVRVDDARASLPPASMTTGVSVSAQAAITRLPVAVEPVNATLSTPARHSAAPVSPKPVTTWRTGRPTDLEEGRGPATRRRRGCTRCGLNTTALPAASA